jgi:hypothetical protein
VVPAPRQPLASASSIRTATQHASDARQLHASVSFPATPCQSKCDWRQILVSAVKLTSLVSVASNIVVIRPGLEDPCSNVLAERHAQDLSLIATQKTQCSLLRNAHMRESCELHDAWSASWRRICPTLAPVRLELLVAIKPQSVVNCPGGDST